MKFALALGLMLSVSAFAEVIESPVVYSNSADLSSSDTQIKLVDARYFEVVTKYDLSKIPGCQENSESNYPHGCDRIKVLERTPVVQVNISYSSALQSDDQGQAWLTLNLPVSDFSAAEIADLKSSRFNRAFAAKTFDLSVTKETRVISIVDVRNSKLCPILENNEPMPGCVEVLRYKDATTTVKAVRVTLK